MTETMNVLSAKRVREVLAKVRQSRRIFLNWWWVLPLAAIAVPSRVPPRKGVRSLGKKFVTIKLRSGLRANCRFNEVYFWYEVFVLEVYNAPQIEWSQIRTILDIGANTGAASIWLSAHSNGAAIFALEPAEETSRRLYSNLAMNGLQERVQVVRMAVGSNVGSGFMIQGDNSAMARASLEAPAGAERVDFIGLDELLQLAGGRIDFMKIDCEGGEYGLFLQASKESLGKVGFIVGEYHPASPLDQQKLFDHLRSSGFQCQIRREGIIDGLEQGIFRAWRTTWNLNSNVQ